MKLTIMHYYGYYVGKLQSGKDVCVFVSHSGRTEETVNAASLVLGKSVKTLGITKKPGIIVINVIEPAHYNIDTKGDPANGLYLL